MKKTLLLALFVLALPAGADEDSRGLEALRAAATRGDVEAQLELGILYEYGFRQPDHLVPALAWYLRAAEAGQGEAAKRRDALTAKLKPAEAEQARRLAPTLVTGTPAVKPASDTSSPARSETDTAPAVAPDPKPSPSPPAALPESPLASKPLF